MSPCQAKLWEEGLNGWSASVSYIGHGLFYNSAELYIHLSIQLLLSCDHYYLKCAADVPIYGNVEGRAMKQYQLVMLSAVPCV